MSNVDDMLIDQTTRELAVKIKANIADAEDKLRINQRRLKRLQKRCKHSNRFVIRSGEQTGWKCPDCFWSN